MTTTSSETRTCNCSLALLATLHEDGDEGELHDLLAGIEDADPVAAAQLVAIVVGDETYGIRPDDLRVMGMQHGWRNPAAVRDMLDWVAGYLHLVQGYRAHNR